MILFLVGNSFMINSNIPAHFSSIYEIVNFRWSVSISCLVLKLFFMNERYLNETLSKFLWVCSSVLSLDVKSASQTHDRHTKPPNSTSKSSLLHALFTAASMMHLECQDSYFLNELQNGDRAKRGWQNILFVTRIFPMTL